MLTVVTVMGVMVAALVFRMAAHHARAVHGRYFLATHGQRASFYERPFYRSRFYRPTTTAERGVTS